MGNGGREGERRQSRRDFLAGLAGATGASAVLGFGMSRRAMGSTDPNCGHFVGGAYWPDATCATFHIESDNGCGKWTGSSFDSDDRCMRGQPANPTMSWPDDGCGNAEAQTGQFLPDLNCGVVQGPLGNQWHTPDNPGGSVYVQTIDGEPVQVVDPDDSCGKNIVPGVDWVDQDNDCAKPAPHPAAGVLEDNSCNMQREMGSTYDDGDCRRQKPGGGEWEDGG